MQILKRSENQIVLKEENFFLQIGICAVAMATFGINMLIEFFLEDSVSFSEDIVGFLVLSAWVLIVLAMAICGFIKSGGEITIDDNGVCYKTWILKKCLKWDEIKDWGLSYCGQTRFEGNTYYFYFSKNINLIKNSCSKKLKGKMIKIVATGNDYYDLVKDIVLFCSERSCIKPFIGEDKYHFM